MREIKFRVWAECDQFPGGKMYLPDDSPPFLLNLSGDLIHHQKTGDISFEAVWARIGFSNIHVMQYTGLKDKNGVEIYEGDIVFHSMTRGYEKLAIGVIEWDDYRAQWRHSRYSEECLSGWKLEVIGNRYENPELLEQNNASPTN